MTDEDCPHRQQLEHTLLHCQTQTEILQATRDNYLSIIEEFQRDLEELTEQVDQQQQHELILKESAQYTEEPPRIGTKELELQNEYLLCQIQNLKCTLRDRELQIQNLNTVVDGFSDHSATDQLNEEIAVLNQMNSKLKEEISILNQINSEQSQKVVEIASLLKTQESERQELRTNYESLMSASDEQCKDLKQAKKEVKCLQDRLGQLEKLTMSLTRERNMLHEELVSLKEKDAINTGRQRALTEQLMARQVEMDKARSLICDMQQQFYLEEQQHKELMDKVLKANEDTRTQLRSINNDCKQMKIKLKQQMNVNEQQAHVIESFRLWKDAQIRSDEAMRKCMKRAEEHIGMLFDENQRIGNEYKRIFNDYTLLECEMRRVKNAINNRTTSSGYAQQRQGLAGGQEVREDMFNRMRFISSTAQRLAQQRRTLHLHSLDLSSQSSQLRAAGGGGGQSLVPSDSRTRTLNTISSTTSI